jgi:hypothetical protein
MNRREMLTVAGAAAAAGVLVSGRTVMGAEQVGSHRAKHRDPIHNECLRACTDCGTVCNETASHCLELVTNGKNEHTAAVELTLACEEFCSLSAKLIARGNPLMFTSCESCAKACDVCAIECEKLATDDQMAACAKACRACAKACREMVHHRR